MVDQFLWFFNEYGFQYLAVGLFIYFLVTVFEGRVTLQRELLLALLFLILWPIIVTMYVALWFRKWLHLR